MEKKWNFIGPDKAKEHPLYGIRGWLFVFAIGSALSPLISLGLVAGEAQRNELTISELLQIDMPIVSFLKIFLFLEFLVAGITVFLLLKKSAQFRQITSIVRLALWPMIALTGTAFGGEGTGEAIAKSFFPWVLSCAVWVTYLQWSKRVRVTFEHQILTDDVFANLTSSQGSQDRRTVRPAIKSPAYQPPTYTSTAASSQNFQASERSMPLVKVHANPTSWSSVNSSKVRETSPSSATAVEKSTVQSLPTEEDHWAAALLEIESGPRRSGIWAKVFSESEGDEAKAKAAYLKVRVQQLNEETYANRALELREAEKVAETQRLQITLEQFVKNAWVTVDSLKAIVWGLEPDVLRSVVVEATSNTLLHVCVHCGLEREVHRLMEIGVNPERRNSEEKVAADIAPTSAILLLLHGMAVMLTEPNELNIVDVPSSITKIMSELTKRNYVYDGRVIREPHGGKFRIGSEYELIKYARLKLDFSAVGKSD